MKIKYTSATGCPIGQFIIEAESDQERAILKSFYDFPCYAKDKWKLHIHGTTHTSNPEGISFNLGYIKKEA